jgi:hypothetical protein
MSEDCGPRCTCVEHKQNLISQIADSIAGGSETIGVNIADGQRFLLYISPKSKTISCATCENTGSVEFSTPLDCVTKLLAHSSFWHARYWHKGETD